MLNLSKDFPGQKEVALKKTYYCPVKGCARVCSSLDALGFHLFQQHQKHELIAFILSYIEARYEPLQV